MPVITITLQFIDAGNQPTGWTQADLIVVQSLKLAALNTGNSQRMSGRKNIAIPTSSCQRWYEIFDPLAASLDIFSDAGVTLVTHDGGACIGTLVTSNSVTLYLKPKPPPTGVGPVIGTAVAAVGVAALSSLVEVQTFLSQQQAIRIYVPASLSRGHQTTTCLIIRRLIAWGYTGAFEVIYESQNDNANTLRLLLAELNLQVVGQDITPNPNNYQSTALGNCVFTFDIRNDGAPPAQQRALGISGGVDNPNVDPKPFCNVQYFLMLQPFQWNAANYLYAQHTRLDLRNEALLNRLQFLGTTCYYQDLTPFDWVNVAPDIARIVDAQAQAAVTCIQANCCVPTAAKLLLPVYGLARAGSQSVLSNWPTLKQTTALANLVIAVLQGQAAAPLNMGTVIMTLDDYGPNWNTELPALLPKKYRDRLTIWTMGSSWNDTSITGLAADGILIVNLPGTLPSPLFSYFYLNSPLPPVFEGKGTMPMMLNSSRPYLQLSKQQNGYDTISALGAHPTVRLLKPFLFPSIPYVFTIQTGVQTTTPNAEASTCFEAQKAIVWNAVPNVVVSAATFGGNQGNFDQIQTYLRQNNFIDSGDRIQLRFCALQNAADFDDPFPTNVISKIQMYTDMQTACGVGLANICTAYQTKLDALSTFFGTAITPNSPLSTYFTALGTHFHNETNDKLLKGMGFAVAAIAQGL